VHELRYYIENSGGEIVGICSLAFSWGSNMITLKDNTITSLLESFGREQLEATLQQLNIAGTVEALTESEGRYLLSFSSLMG
jgi:hypothetical protein